MDNKFSKFELRFKKFDKALGNLQDRIILLENNEFKFIKMHLKNQ